MRILPLCILSIAILFSSFSFCEDKTNYLSVEGALVWQSKNDQRIPGNTGTLFSLSDFDRGPFKAYRIYAGKRFNKKHEIRLLYAPLELKLTGEFNQAVNYMGRTFAAGVSTSAYYKFNSYRLTYAYHFDKIKDWELACGLSGKIRDAEVSLTQRGITEQKKNVGFVPLINFQARRALHEKWAVSFDLDGLAAPQGRAFDAAFFLEHNIFAPEIIMFGGYRTVEGGANNDKVYNFAWFHYAVLGLKGFF